MGKYGYTRVGAVTINGVELDVMVSEGGMFALETQGDNPQTLGSGDTLEKAKAAARVQVAKSRVEVSVPFIVIEQEGRRFGGRGAMKFRRGIARGLHGRSGEVLVTYDDDGSKGTLSSNATTFPPDTDEGLLTEYIERSTRAAEERRVAQTIERDNEMRLGGAVRDAIDAAAREVTSKAEAEAEPLVMGRSRR